MQLGLIYAKKKTAQQAVENPDNTPAATWPGVCALSNKRELQVKPAKTIAANNGINRVGVLKATAAANKLPVSPATPMA